MFARFDENPAMTLQDIKETKRYGRTDARTDPRTDNVKTVYPPQTKFAGGIKIKHETKILLNLPTRAMKLITMHNIPVSILKRETEESLNNIT